MNIEAIAIGDNPPDDVNVIIEVPIGGEPIKYEMNKAAGAIPGITASFRTPFLTMAIRSTFSSPTRGRSRQAR